MRYASSAKLARLLVCLCGLGVAPLLAQSRQGDDARRDAWQKVDEISSAIHVQAGGPANTRGETADPALRVTQEEFKKLLAAGAVTVVDVRDAGAFAAGHIPGALSIPLDTVGQAAERLRGLGKTVVTYCS